MKKFIDDFSIREFSQNIFRETFRLYNKVYSRKIELSNDVLGRIFERVHAKALKFYDRKTWGSLRTDDEKFWFSENPDEKSDYPLVPVLINYVKALLTDRFPEIAYPEEPKKAAVEIFILVFIYSYFNAVKKPENKLTLIPSELISSAIDPIVDHLVVNKDKHSFNSLSIDLIIDILKLNNILNQAHNLKGLYNQPAINRIWKEKDDDSVIVGVIMLDGDNFKMVNDNCGHDVGDEVLEIYRDSILKAIELTIKQITRAFPARWGGEEFCVFVFESNEDEITGLSKKIRSELKSHPKWEDLKGRKYDEKKKKVDFPRTFSQGVALGRKSDFGYANALVKIAETQMYKAKDEPNKNSIYYSDRKISD